MNCSIHPECLCLGYLVWKMFHTIKIPLSHPILFMCLFASYFQVCKDTYYYSKWMFFSSPLRNRCKVNTNENKQLNEWTKHWIEQCAVRFLLFVVQSRFCLVGKCAKQNHTKYWKKQSSSMADCETFGNAFTHLASSDSLVLPHMFTQKQTNKQQIV